MHILGPGIWRETLKKVKNEKCTLRTWNMAKKLENKIQWKLTQ